MRKEGYCAFGARQTVEASQALLRVMEAFGARDHAALEDALHAAHRLQTSLTLFRGCYPKTRIALWKRRLRRLTRALNALRDHHQLIQRLESLTPPPEHRRGVQRALLRLRQRAETHADALQGAWQQWLTAHAPHEIHGLSKRWVESFGEEPIDAAYLERQWRQFSREQASALDADTRQSLEVRCGRLRALLEGARLLRPLTSQWLDEQPIREALRRLEAERWTQQAQRALHAIAESEREQMQRYAGNLRGYAQIRRGIEWAMRQILQC
ncbi:MAG: CHAD domain-containing protein [Fimbriimonadales bacterium]